jgi:hypothetical protein
MRANRVFRVEDINQMSLTDVNPVGPDGYDIFEWRGSYNCRHRWVQLMYESEASIVNKASVRKGLIEEDDMPGPDTLTTSARDAGYPPRTGFNSSNPDVSSLSPYVDQVTKKVVRKPVLAAGLEDACWEGYEPIGLKDDGSPNCVPIKEEMSEDGSKVLLSLPLFENKEDAEAMAIAIGCNGSHPHTYGDKTLYMPCEKHPDNFATQDELSTFQVFNTEQRLVVGPAMIPDKMIIRRNEITGEIYYVYFTAETIKKLQQKFMIQKLLDKTNVEHGRKFLNDVDVVESWIVDNREKDKQQVFGMDYPEGTWMVTMKVTDDDTWNKVKDGKLKGFSVQGYFAEKAKFSQINNDLIEEIKNILKQVN